MKNKFPIILIILLSIFALFKISFSYLYIDSIRDSSMKFEKIIGSLRYSIKPYEENSLKLNFIRLIHRLDNTNGKSKQSSDESFEETVYYTKEKISKEAISMNKKLNKYTKKYIQENPPEAAKTESDSEKTVIESYLDTQEIVDDIEFNEKKAVIQKIQLDNLKDILSDSDYTQLSEIIDDMNKYDKHSNISTQQKILSILLKYNDINSYMILGQLCGKFEILAYYEIQNGNILKKDLKAISTRELSDEDDRKYKNLVNMQTILLDVIYSKYFKGFFIFTDEEKGLLAYATDFQNKQRGYLGIDASDFSSGISNDFEKSRFYHSVVSELSKVILLGNNQVDYTKSNAISDTKNFELIREFSKKDSYLLQFYSRFWDDLLYLDSYISKISTDENASKYFFLRHSRDFLNEYVAQDPIRDIIESLTIFMLEKKPLDADQKYQKIRFFYEFSELSDIKQRLSLNIKHLEE